MKAKAIISALAVIFHILIMVWYYSHPRQWHIDNKEIASVWFFGITFILIGLNLFLTSINSYFLIQLEIAKFHSVFILLLGTIYGLHYSEIMTTTNKEKLVMICAGALLIFIIIIVSAWRHGFFNKETYD